MRALRRDLDFDFDTRYYWTMAKTDEKAPATTSNDEPPSTADASDTSEPAAASEPVPAMVQRFRPPELAQIIAQAIHDAHLEHDRAFDWPVILEATRRAQNSIQLQWNRYRDGDPIKF